MARGGKTVGPRGEATKTAILDSARGRFAADGYERATIRAIAADAAIDPALVMRYFGNKEKLFAEAAKFDLRVPDLSEIPRKGLGAGLVGHFLDRWENDDTLKALLRASVSNKAAAARIRTIFETQLVAAIGALFEDRARATARAGLVSVRCSGWR